MTPAPHIGVYTDPVDGAITFVCNFCGATAGPFPPGVQLAHVELYHHPDCFHTESVRLNMHSAMGRMDN